MAQRCCRTTPSPVLKTDIRGLQLENRRLLDRLLSEQDELS
ncbi:hypothetical protein [Leptolyngbya sp. FACHB-36]|nr:hypothetical protein [Leptolyngbya sp. FACHB-36]